MSHVVSIATRVHDPLAVTAACQRLGLPTPVQGTSQLYSSEAAGLLVELPGWRYPVVIDTASGTISFDHYGGHWGDPAQLDRFLQSYAVEKCRLEARMRGLPVSETLLVDGSIKVQIVEGP